MADDLVGEVPYLNENHWYIQLLVEILNLARMRRVADINKKLTLT